MQFSFLFRLVSSATDSNKTAYCDHLHLSGIVVVTRRHGSYNPSKPGASFSATRLHAPAHCRKMMKLDSSTDTAPFVAMALVEIGEVGMITLGKAAMSSGMSNFVYVVYYNALGTFILLHYFIYNTYRICLVQIFAITGIKYSSPTLASAMGNLIPGITFLLAVFFRMEKVAIRSRSSQAKILGTVVSIAGAFIVSLYKGPPLLGFSSPSNSNIQLPVSEYSNWALGGLLLTVTCFSSATWKIFQAAVLKEYPDKINLVFFSCFFGTIQCAVVSIIVERNPSAWKLQPGIQRTAVIYAAIVGTVIRSSIIAWCLQKKGPVFVALFKPLGTAIAVFMAVMFLGETPHLGSLIGAVVIAFGFYAVIWAQGKESNMTTGNLGITEPKVSTLEKYMIEHTEEDKSDDGKLLLGYKGIAYSSPTLASAISNHTPAFTFILAIVFSTTTVVPPFKLSLLLRIFLLSSIGVLSQTVGYIGIAYSSPTLSAAITNTIPAFTFTLAILFRMEKLTLRSRITQAKIIGAIVSISGALLVVLSKGPAMFLTSPSTHSKPLFQWPLCSSLSNWVTGGLLLIAQCLLNSIWYILQAHIIKIYPAELVVVSLYLPCASII
ncbi:hypothetical protein CUMW_099090 [Citrus unshiu]|nr:hypothetical protein CUMW_099090 [Citrus unshiu]